MLTNLPYTGECVVPDKMVTDPATWRDHLERYVFALQWAHKRAVLDAGCGTGYGSWILSTVARWVIGVDQSRQHVAYAIEHFGDEPRLGFKRAELPCSSMNDALGPVDVVVAFEVIEHIDCPRAFVQGLPLRPGGDLVFSAPTSPADSSPYHRWSVTAAKLRALLAGEYGEVRLFGQNGRVIDDTRELRPGNEAQYIVGVARRRE